MVRKPRVLALVWRVIVLWLLAELLLAGILIARGGGLARGLLIFATVSGAGILAAEAGFRALFRLVKGMPYPWVPKLRLSDMYMEPHPHLSLSYKRRATTQRSTDLNYPLHREKKFSIGRLVSNNFRHLDGPNGDRDIIMPKPRGTVRVLCLGASTTGNYIDQDGRRYSYPLEMEKSLARRFGEGRVIVHNCGHGGWTSADILIDFLLNLYDTQPDVVVLYHAYNDLPASMTPGFVADYSHARRNFGETFYMYQWAQYVPDLPIAVYNYIVNTVLPYMNPKSGAWEATCRGVPDLEGPFHGLPTYRRNVEHLVKFCRQSGIDMVLSTFAHFLYKGVEQSPEYQKYREGVRLENEEVRGLASLHDVPLVDNARLIPEREEYFVDSVHFTPEGMTMLGENLAQEVAKLVEKRILARPD